MSLELRNDLAGSAVFWTLGEMTDHAALSQALRACGFERFLPEKMTSYAALKKTLEEELTGCEIFPVKGVPNTFEAVRVVRDAATDKNEYRHVMTARVTGWFKIETDCGPESDIRLTERFERNMSMIPYHQVTRALIAIVYELGGVTLRPSGGIYWIPNAQWERWQRVANAVECAGRTNKVFALRTFLDEHSAAVLREALAAEIEREAHQIDETLHDSTTGFKAAATCKRRANDLRRKIAAYEDAFQMALPDLKRALDHATGQEAIATLMDAANDGPLLRFAESA